MEGAGREPAAVLTEGAGRELVEETMTGAIGRDTEVGLAVETDAIVAQWLV